MCKAIDDMLMESRKKGIATGKKAGIRAGKKMGIKAGRMDKLLSQIKIKLAKGKSVDVIADELEEPVELIAKLVLKLQA